VDTNPGETKAIVAAMLAVQTGMKAAVKDAKNPAFKSTYADLASVWEACRDALKAAKVLVSQDVTSDENGVSIATRFTHESTQWMEFGPLFIPLAKKDAQAVGSAVSYGRRYSLSAALGIIAEDDDGNAASQSHHEPAQRTTNGHAPPAPKPSGPAKITSKDRDTLRNEAKSNQWPRDDYYKLLGRHGFKADDDVTTEKFPVILACLRNGTLTPPETTPVDSEIPF
jgi:hypothetical protein